MKADIVQWGGASSKPPNTRPWHRLTSKYSVRPFHVENVGCSSPNDTARPRDTPTNATKTALQTIHVRTSLQPTPAERCPTYSVPKPSAVSDSMVVSTACTCSRAVSVSQSHQTQRRMHHIRLVPSRNQRAPESCDAHRPCHSVEPHEIAAG